jgi:hypothetical protein
MSSYGNSLVATNVSLQRPIKMNYNTGLSTDGESLPTIVINETNVVVNTVVPPTTDPQHKGGLTEHAAYEVAYTAPSSPVPTSTLLLTIPGTTGSSAYKPEIELMYSNVAQYSGTGEDVYVVRNGANSFSIARVARGGGNLAHTLYVYVRFTVNTDALQPNS